MTLSILGGAFLGYFLVLITIGIWYVTSYSKVEKKVISTVVQTKENKVAIEKLKKHADDNNLMLMIESIPEFIKTSPEYLYENPRLYNALGDIIKSINELHNKSTFEKVKKRNKGKLTSEVQKAQDRMNKLINIDTLTSLWNQRTDHTDAVGDLPELPS
jgi:hypothetical protein